MLIRRALTKSASETYFVDLNFYEKTFAACKDARRPPSPAPVYQKYPGEPWMRLPVHRPGISSLQSLWSLFADCWLVVMRNVRAVFEQNGCRPQFRVRDSPKMKYDSIMMLISIEQDI